MELVYITLIVDRKAVHDLPELTTLKARQAFRWWQADTNTNEYSSSAWEKTYKWHESLHLHGVGTRFEVQLEGVVHKFPPFQCWAHAAQSQIGVSNGLQLFCWKLRNIQTKWIEESGTQKYRTRDKSSHVQWDVGCMHERTIECKLQVSTANANMNGSDCLQKVYIKLMGRS